MNHVVLLGDSIFDNASYVPDGPAVIDQLRGQLPPGWKATLLAVDGAVVGGVASRQLPRVPADVTHLVVSVGGNNALGHSPILGDEKHTAAEGYAILADIQDEFRREYRAMLEAVLTLRKPTAICTVYDAIPGLPRVAVTALCVFNDVILREGFRRGLPILDLRLICTSSGDYSHVSPIEPSRVGGAKIAHAIRRVVTGHDFTRAESVVYGA